MWLARSRGAGSQLPRGFYCAALAVGKFRDVAPFTGPSVPGPLLIALSLPWWERRLEVLGALVPQCHFPVSSCGWSSEWLQGLVRVLWIIRAVVPSAQQLCFLQSLEVHPCHAPHSSSICGAGHLCLAT